MRRLVSLFAVAVACLALTPSQQQPRVRTVGKLDLSVPSGPQLSPNGRFLAITTGDSVLVMEVASGRHWTVLRGYVEFMDWSPSGNLLTLNRSDPEANTEHIWTLPIDPNTGRASGEAQRVSTSGGDVVSFSPDGQSIAFADYQKPGQRLVVVPARGGRERVLAEPKVGINSIAWSIDGKWVYYSHTDRKHIERVTASILRC